MSAKETPELTGRWVNTDTQPDWFRAIEFREDQGVLTIAPESIKPPLEWGTAPVETFDFKSGETAFFAVFSLPDLEVKLTAYTNKGLVVLATYFDHASDGQRNYLCRDFFVPIPRDSEVEHV